MPSLSPKTIAYIIAVGLPVIYIWFVWQLDVFKSSNLTVLIICIVWGATGAFSIAYAINTAVANVIGFALVTAITAPILEEILKASVLVYFIQRPSFRYFVDGAIYGFGVGIGFAAVENLSCISCTMSPPLALAVSRVLSTALMHAVASAIVGLSLGALRRIQVPWRRYLHYSGILLAISLHVFFNNVVGWVQGVWLLPVAIGISIVGGAVISWLIEQELRAEKKRFSDVLGQDISNHELEAIQNLGSVTLTDVLKENFPNGRTATIRRLLEIQANIGILQNNLNSGRANQRLRKAWQKEIEELQAEVKRLRQELGLLSLTGAALIGWFILYQP